MADNPSTNLSLGAEFTDLLATELLLQPDPELIFARWANSAKVQAQMSNEDGFDLARLQLLEGRMAQSGAPSNMAEAMSQGMGGPLLVSLGMNYPDMFKMVQEAKQPGEVIKIDRPRFVDGVTTEANRQMTQVGKVFGNSQPVTMDQVDVTIREYAGPGDPVTGNPVPFSLALFTQHRSKHDLLQYIGYQLRRDRHRFVDDIVMSRMIAAAGATTTGTTRGGDVASDAAFSGVGNEPMSFDLAPKIVEAMAGRYVPGIGGGGQYVAVLDIHQVQQLANDPAYQRLSRYYPERSPLFPGYQFDVGRLIVCASNRMPRLTNLGAGANIAGYQGLVFAPGVLGWALAMDAIAIRDKNDDGGRFARFAWLAFEGWQTMDDRFVQLIKTT